jgi:uncharacterized protein YjbI with pentapeptide repeats
MRAKLVCHASAPRTTPAELRPPVRGFADAAEGERARDRPRETSYGVVDDMRPTRKAVKKPILPAGLEARAIESLDGLDLEACRVEACALAQARAEHVRFDGVHVVGGTLAGAKLTRLTWLDVLCERADLSMVDWPAAKLTRVEIRDCRVTGAKLEESELVDVRFVGCQIDFGSFSGARLRQVSFEGCRLEEADFGGADLGAAAFVDCNLRGIDLTRARLQGVDVSASTLSEVRVGAADVRGLVVNRDQATALAQLFGLVVRDT